MAPTGLWTTVKSYYTGEQAKDVPAISAGTAIALLIFYTFIYIVPFYLTSTTRPSQQLSRDAPSVIRGRIFSVSWSCAACSISTFVLLSSVENGNPLRSIHQMGCLPPGFVESAKCLGLTCILFLGPLFEAGLAEGSWRYWIRLRGIGEVLGSWIGYRNLVAGPVTEEILFRSCSVPLFVIAKVSLVKILFGTPIIFGLGHVHHFYEFRITHPHTPLPQAIIRSVFQLGYTTLFGAYATFLYIRTGSLLAVIIVHTFCNWMGLPRFWGRLTGGGETLIGPDDSDEVARKREDDINLAMGKTGSGPQRLGVLWTITYYVLLVVGAVGWWKSLWVLTESPSALMKF